MSEQDEQGQHSQQENEQHDSEQHDSEQQDSEQQKNAHSEPESATVAHVPAEPATGNEASAATLGAEAAIHTDFRDVANSSAGNTRSSARKDIPPSGAAPVGIDSAVSAATQQPQPESIATTAGVPSTESESRVSREQSSQAADAKVLAVSRQHTRRSFLGAAAAVTAGVGLYQYLNVAPSEDMQPVPIADAFKFNASFSRDVLPQQALSPTYPLSRAETLRINGVYGLKKDIVPESWRLQLVGMKDASQHSRFVPDVTAWDYQYKTPPASEDKGHDTKVDPSKQASADPAKADDVDSQDENHTGRKKRGMEEAGESDSTLPPHTPGLLLQLSDITRLPRVELVTQFKCIEGWSQIVHWAGVRMADFLELYPPALIEGKEPDYIYMETPDGDYYTGYDMDIMRHPQTLLVTEMMGAPITQNHGAPLRLHMPTKYGYKQIKRIGLIAYTNDKPDDYWTKLGYDWYAGL